MSITESVRPLIYFLSFVGPNYSRSSTVLNFHSSEMEKKYLQFNPGIIGIIRTILYNRDELRSASAIVVMSPCQLIAPFAKVLLRKKLILDAGWPLTDGNLSRGVHKRKPFSSFLLFLLDLISFHVSDKILLESQSQVIRCKKLFRVHEKKMIVRFTGLDESKFKNLESKSKLIKRLESEIEIANKSLTVIFRGKINRESGFDLILETAGLMSDLASFIFVVGPGQNDLSLPKNVHIVSEISNAEMQYLYQLADVSLGQISNHKRLDYTIPHKAFESAYFSKCYVTANSKGISELFDENSVIYLSEISTSGLHESLALLLDKNVRKKYCHEISKVYNKKTSQMKINAVFDRSVRNTLAHDS